jgi:hypothetical protein
MACAELARLKREHDQALSVWALFRLPMTVEIPGQQDESAIHQEALDERNRTADLLYTYRRTCPKCKHGDDESPNADD